MDSKFINGKKRTKEKKMASSIDSPGALILGTNTKESWKNFIQRFKVYLKATESYNKPDDIKIAKLLHFRGEEAFQIYYNSYK